MLYKHANFYTFSYNMIIDIRGMRASNYFIYDKIKFKMHSPYKTYPFNFDFVPKPFNYRLPNGKMKPLPPNTNVAVYPVYGEKNQEHIGFTMQHHENWQLKEQTPFYPAGSNFPDKLPHNFVPVDTIRFDTDQEYVNDSPKFLKTFLNHLRNFSGQWWITKMHYDSIGVSVTGKIDFNDNIKKTFSASPMFTFKANFGKPIGIKIWKEAIDAMVNGIDIDISRSLVLDAHYDLFSSNYRGVVLNLANAIDIAINKFFIKIWTEEKGKMIDEFDRKIFVRLYKINKKISDTFIPGLITEFTSELVSRDYNSEFPIKFKIIDEFWRNKRNPVAHGSDVSFEWEEGFLLLDTLEHVRNWVSKL